VNRVATAISSAIAAVGQAAAPTRVARNSKTLAKVELSIQIDLARRPSGRANGRCLEVLPSSAAPSSYDRSPIESAAVGDTLSDLLDGKSAFRKRL
jgi:hypothetical protein